MHHWCHQRGGVYPAAIQSWAKKATYLSSGQPLAMSSFSQPLTNTVGVTCTPRCALPVAPATSRVHRPVQHGRSDRTNSNRAHRL